MNFWIGLILLNIFHNIEVINKGIPGNNSFDLLSRVQQDVVSYQPDLVIMMVGTNDFCNDRKFVSPDQYEKNLDQLISLISQNSSLILLTILPIEWEKLFQRHSRQAYPDDFDILIYRCNKIIKSKRAYCAVIDMNNFFKLAEGWFIDGVHQTDVATRFMAAVIYQYIVDHFCYFNLRKIVCFGDSITRSCFLKFQYSDYLSMLLNE